MSTVPVFAPDGSLGDIPAERLTDAVKAGFKPGITMKSQDGQTGVIPADRMPDAAKSGMQIVPLQQQETQHPGFWSTVISDLAGIVPKPSEGGVPSPYPGVTPEVGQANWKNAIAQAQSEKAAGYSKPYMAAAGVAQGLGVNVPGMEQSAAQGDRAGVAGHAVAGAAPYVVGDAIKQTGSAVADALPSKDRAGEAFQSVMSAAKDVTVDLSTSQDSILKLVDWQKKTNLGPTVNKFLNRITAPDKGPLTYGEARDYYTLLSRLSADETSKLAPPVMRDLIQTVAGLKNDIGNAAGQVGKSADYYSAMDEFRRASNLQELKDAAAKIGTQELVKGAVRGAGLGVGGAIGYGIYKSRQ